VHGRPVEMATDCGGPRGSVRQRPRLRVRRGGPLLGAVADLAVARPALRFELARTNRDYQRRGRDSLRCSAALPPALLGTFSATPQRIRSPAFDEARQELDGANPPRRSPWLFVVHRLPTRFESLPRHCFGRGLCVASRFRSLRRGRDSNPSSSGWQTFKRYATLRPNAARQKEKMGRIALSAGDRESTGVDSGWATSGQRSGEVGSSVVCQSAPRFMATARREPTKRYQCGSWEKWRAEPHGDWLSSFCMLTSCAARLASEGAFECRYRIPKSWSGISPS
jgi:hypothetical protein